MSAISSDPITNIKARIDELKASQDPEDVRLCRTLDAVVDALKSQEKRLKDLEVEVNRAKGVVKI